MRRCAAIAVAIAVSISLVAGCSADDDGGPAGGSSGTAEPTGSAGPGRSGAEVGAFGSGSAFSVEAALAEVPATYDEEGLLLCTGDLSAASEQAGFERPTSVTDADAVVDWAMVVTGSRRDDGDVFVPVSEALGLRTISSVDEFAAELGWSILDVDAFVDASVSPARLTVVTGDELGAEVLADAELDDLGEGVYSAGDGDDLQFDPQEVTVARPLGQPLRMAAVDGRLAASSTQAGVRSWLAGPSASLADVERYAVVGAALDAADPYAAVLHRPSVRGSTARPGGPRPEGPGLTAPYELAGIGWSVVDGEAVITLVHHFGDGATAEAQVGALRSIFEDGATVRSARPLADTFEVRSVEADGPLTTTTLALRGDGTAADAHQLLLTRDLPFAPPT